MENQNTFATIGELKAKEVLETSYLKIANKNPRYSKTERLVATLEAIAKCRARINSELNFCNEFYGRDFDGNRIGNPYNRTKIAKYMAISNRLKQYYNNQLTQLTKF